MSCSLDRLYRVCMMDATVPSTTESLTPADVLEAVARGQPDYIGTGEAFGRLVELLATKGWLTAADVTHIVHGSPDTLSPADERDLS